MAFWMFLAMLFAAAPAPAPAPEPGATPSPQRVLGLIRAAFRAHRPPPPFVSYTMVRSQKDSNGFPDYVGSYTYHIWCRTSDRASLARKVFRNTYRGSLEWQRQAFNERIDPGPPTADVFEPAPAKSRPANFVPTPEPPASPLRVIGETGVVGEFDYAVRTLAIEGDQVHLTIEPTRDPDRNRLREIWADKKTYEIKQLAATDKLFYGTGRSEIVYGVRFIVKFATLEGFPIITDIHGVVGDNYNDDGKEVDFKYSAVTFPKTLPDWYFDAKSYASHTSEAPL
ncbi:MAG: hypothetical protein GIW95_06815 [Candidatus Eremiobacteraeota bacterium]|nr:hypothetical protein [Candidatus Eremiobacteraeota bacterium]